MDLETIEQLEAKHNIHCNIMSIENSINEVYGCIEGCRQPELMQISLNGSEKKPNMWHLCVLNCMISSMTCKVGVKVGSKNHS